MTTSDGVVLLKAIKPDACTKGVTIGYLDDQVEPGAGNRAIRLPAPLGGVQ